MCVIHWGKGAILHIEEKLMDTHVKTCLNLERMRIRRLLWMKKHSDTMRKGRLFFTVKQEGKKKFLKFLSSVKFSDEYASNISCCVNVEGGKFFGLKSHNCYVLL